MKTKIGFVSNSSSTSFIITNKTNKDLTVLDFVKENPQLVEEFCSQYDWNNYTQEEMIESAKKNYTQEAYKIPAKSEKAIAFGDGDGTVVGEVFDYILRDGGSSKSFTWKYHESLR